MFHNVTDAVRISIQDLNIQLLIKYIYIYISLYIDIVKNIKMQESTYYDIF